MTALMKYLAVLGFAGALSLAATTSFATAQGRGQQTVEGDVGNRPAIGADELMLPSSSTRKNISSALASLDCLVIQFLNNNHSDFTFWRTDNSPRDAAVR
jgi:hypothetical protein